MKNLLAWIARTTLGLFGWRVEGQPPTVQRYVLIAAPHTSAWDLPIMLLVAMVYGVRLRWFGKHTLFQAPWGWLMTVLGGIPVNRSQRNQLVQNMTELFRMQGQLVLAIAPEGTRRRAATWKTGFYHIAHAAGVPIVCGFIDFKRQVSGVGPTIMPTGDIEADWQVLRDFYSGITGLYPEQVGDVQLQYIP